MSEKYLDIHIIYSDKDKKYLVSLLKKYRNFKIKNSVNNWKVSLKVHNNSGINNIGQFQRRLEIIRNTPSGHYIWFVDGDDEIINSADLKGDIDNIDIYLFSHKMFCGNPKETYEVETTFLDKNTIIEGYNTYSSKNAIYNQDKPMVLSEILGAALWNKWFKVDVWKNIYEYLKEMGYENIRPNASEDCFYVFYALKNTQKIFYSTTSIYFYRNDRSLIFNASRNFIKYKNFLNFRKGHKEITEAILKLNIPELGDHFIYIDKVCHLEKALLCLEIKKALQNVVGEFGKEDILDILKNHSEDICIPHNTVKYLAYKYLTK